MKSQIACKLKNSFAIDSKEDLYSWGSYESGLLGYEESSDVQTPTKILFEENGEEYKVEYFSLGHYHAGAICRIKDHMNLEYEKSPEITKFVNSFRRWYETTFIWDIADVRNYCRGILRTDANFENVTFKRIKKYLLEAFLAWMKLNKKDSFNMKTFYESNLKTLLGISNDKTFITSEKFDVLFRLDEKKTITMTQEEKSVLVFPAFLKKCYVHTKQNTKDLMSFLRFLLNFKTQINEKDIKKVLKYGNFKTDLPDQRNEIRNAAKAIFEMIKNSLNKDKFDKNKNHLNNNNNLNNNSLQKTISGDKLNPNNKNNINNNVALSASLNNNNHNNNTIPARYFLDLICNINSGEGILFTWGASCDGRLGYKLTKDFDHDKNKKNTFGFTPHGMDQPSINVPNYTIDLDQIQITPKIVLFEIPIQIKKIACGYSHTLALACNNKVYSWGNGKYGCLGNSKDESNYYPKPIEYDIGNSGFENIKNIGCGMFYSVAIDATGIFTWGCGNNGRLGHGDEHSVSAPKKIKFFEDKGVSIKSFSCGDTHIGAIDDNDCIYTWGSGTYGKLGHGYLEDYSIPTKIDVLQNYKIDYVSCGSNDTIAITSDLKVFSWGKNASGLLGTLLLPDKNILIPTLMSLSLQDATLGIIEVSVGSIHILLKLSNGDLYTCGSTINGISGILNAKNKNLELKKIPGFKCVTEDEDDLDYKNLIKGFNLGFTVKTNNKKSVKFIYVKCSQDNTAFITQNGDLFMSGKRGLMFNNNDSNNLTPQDCSGGGNNANNINNSILTSNGKTIGGNGNDSTNITYGNNNSSTPTPDAKTPANGETQANNGNYNSYHFNNSDTPAGYNLSDNARENGASEKFIKRLIFNQKVSYIAIAKTHAILISEYRAYGWGSNYYGVLGIGDRRGDVARPTLIEKLPSNLCMVCCSDTHSLALTMNGEIYAFGLNNYGKLGIGSIKKYLDFISKEDTEDGNNVDLPIEYEPQLVQKITFAYFIACGNNHSACIMKNEDNRKFNVFTWGSGYSGKLGNGSIKDCHEPTACFGREALNCTHISCGDEFTLVLDENGILYGAGKNIYLGKSSEKEFSSKDLTMTLEILDKENYYSFISSSNHYSVAIDREGKMFGFGKIYRDKLESDFTKQEIKCSDKMKFVSCGLNHFASLSQVGMDVFTWGSNSFTKCGQDFYKGAGYKVEIKSKYFPIPKKLNLDNFENLDLNNRKYDSEDENDNEESSKDDTNSKQGENSDASADADHIMISLKKAEKKNQERENRPNLNNNINDDANHDNNDSFNANGNNDLSGGLKKKELQVNKKRALLQNRLLGERQETKNAGLIEEDSKLVSNFYKSFGNFYNLLRNVVWDYKSKIQEVENNILRFINISSEFRLNNRYISDIPKIINMNFQIYESFLNIIQQHPCYLADLLKQINNKQTFCMILKMAFGRSRLLLNSPRVSNLFLGLWNNLFSSDQNIKSDTINDENTSYRIYNLLLTSNQDTLLIIRETISEVFVFYINEICLYYEREETKTKNALNNDSNLAFTYKELLDMPKKLELSEKAVSNICNSIRSYFGNMIQSFIKPLNKDKVSVTYPKNVLWIFKNLILKEYKESQKSEGSSTHNNDFFDYDNSIFDDYFIKFDGTGPDGKLKKNFNNFLFSPFAEMLKEILNDNNSEELLSYVSQLEKQIILCIERFKKKYSKVYNLYKQDAFNFKKNYIQDLFAPNSALLKDVYNIFNSLAKSSFAQNTNNYRSLEEMNLEFCMNLKNFRWDFTFNALQEMIKYSLDKGNTSVVLSLRVEELISLQKFFNDYSFEKLSEEKKDPLYNVLNIMSSFKIDELETTSNIRNFVINITIRPLTYLFDYHEDVKIIRCSKCLLPLNERFFSSIKFDELIYGTEWNCSRSSSYLETDLNEANNNNNNKESQDYEEDEEEEGEEEDYSCKVHDKLESECKISGKYKPKFNIIHKNNLFRKYYVKNNYKLLNLYEEVLYILPKIGPNDDFFKIIAKEKDTITVLKSKSEEWKLELFDDFILEINKTFSTSGVAKNEGEKINRLDLLNQHLEINLNLRREHQNYIKSIYDLMDYMKNSIENSKTKLAFFENDNNNYNDHVLRGYSQEYFKEKTEKPQIIRLYQYKLKNIRQENKFYKLNVNSLITDKIIDNIELTNKDGEGSFMRKSYLVFSRVKQGYNIKYCYKDQKRKYVLCGLQNQEFVIDEFLLDNEKISELRRNAKNNPSFTIGDIRFNIFYLVKLLNSFENVNN